MVAKKSSKRTKKRVSKKKVAPKAAKLAKRKRHKYHQHIKTSILIFAVLTVLLIISVIASYPKMRDKGVIARVNGKAITQADLDDQFSKIPAQFKNLVTKKDLLEQMINEEVLLQEATDKGITATEGDVDEILRVTMAQLNLSEAELEARIAEQGMTLPELKELYMKQLKVTKLIEQEVLPNIDVEDTDLQKMYDSTIHARHILVATEEEAQDIIDQLNGGADFAELANEKSLDSAPGGDLGEFGKGVMVPDFESAAFTLEIGEISEPIHTQFGYHVIERLDKESTFEEMKDSLRSKARQNKQTKAITKYVQDLRTAADVEILQE
ncbi:MAG: peptidylprolyl isomerase [Candidatus Nanoarchaeia archaeon]